MTAAVVLDASVTLAFLIASQGDQAAFSILTEIRHGVSAIVPVLWFPETANGLLVAQRRRRLTPVQRQRALALLADVAVQIDDASGQTAFRRTSQLAEEHGLTVYDATYLELALRRGARLASRDAALRSAARRSGVTVIG